MRSELLENIYAPTLMSLTRILCPIPKGFHDGRVDLFAGKVSHRILSYASTVFSYVHLCGCNLLNSGNKCPIVARRNNQAAAARRQYFGGLAICRTRGHYH